MPVMPLPLLRTIAHTRTTLTTPISLRLLLLVRLLHHVLLIDGGGRVYANNIGRLAAQRHQGRTVPPTGLRIDGVGR
jgi:hypothetical protein